MPFASARHLLPGFVITVIAGAALAATPAQPASAPHGYDQPPKAILDVLHAPAPPTVYTSPTRQALLLVSWQEFPPMSRVAAPFLKLAGSRVEIANHSKHDTPGGYGITPCAHSFGLVAVPGGAATAVQLPVGACAGRPYCRRTASASRSPTPPRIRWSCGSATPPPARCAGCRACA